MKYKNTTSSQYDPTFGIAERLTDYGGIISIIAGVGFLIAFLIYDVSNWYIWVFVSVVAAWMSPIAILLSVFLLEIIVWTIIHPSQSIKALVKNAKPILSVAAVIILLFLMGDGLTSCETKTTLKEEYNAMQGRIEELESRITDLEDEILINESKISDLQDENEALRSDISDLEDEIL